MEKIIILLAVLFVWLSGYQILKRYLNNTAFLTLAPEMVIFAGVEIVVEVVLYGLCLLGILPMIISYVLLGIDVISIVGGLVMFKLEEWVWENEECI